MAKSGFQITGLVFFQGIEHIPRDIILSIGNIRKWAFDEGLVTDPEFQLLVSSRLDEVSRFCTWEDQVQVAVAIHPGDGRPFYFEYPFLPAKSLIRRADEIELYYWRMRPTRWDTDGNITKYGEVRFGFLFSGCGEEFCSLSTAKFVVERFDSKFGDIADDFPVNELQDGSKEITLDGGVLARFSKEGRYFIVDLKLKE